MKIPLFQMRPGSAFVFGKVELVPLHHFLLCVSVVPITSTHPGTQYSSISIDTSVMEDGQAADSRMGAKYQWEPNPIMAVVVGVITVIIVLIPAVCSVCYHVHMRKNRRKVRKDSDLIFCFSLLIKQRSNFIIVSVSSRVKRHT